MRSKRRSPHLTSTRWQHPLCCDQLASPVPLFDVQTGCEGFTAGQKQTLSVHDLTKEMRRVTIQRALVRIVPDDLIVDIVLSNEKLYDIYRRRPWLVPCPIVLPASAGDIAPETGQVDEHIKRGAGAVWVRPSADSWIIAEWASGNLFSALAARRMPVYCAERYISLEQVAILAARYPELPLIVSEVGYSAFRTIIPLLQRFSSVYLSIGSVFTGHRAIERLVELAGAEHLVFGTGFPPAEPMAAIAQLMYAEIGARERELIAHGNLEKLLRSIQK